MSVAENTELLPPADAPLIALIHGLGTGTDTGAIWMWALDAVCFLTVVVAVIWRATAADRATVVRESALPPRSQRVPR